MHHPHLLGSGLGFAQFPRAAQPGNASAPLQSATAQETGAFVPLPLGLFTRARGHHALLCTGFHPSCSLARGKDSTTVRSQTLSWCDFWGCPGQGQELDLMFLVDPF